MLPARYCRLATDIVISHTLISLAVYSQWLTHIEIMHCISCGKEIFVAPYIHIARCDDCEEKVK